MALSTFRGLWIRCFDRCGASTGGVIGTLAENVEHAQSVILLFFTLELKGDVGVEKYQADRYEQQQTREN